MGKEKFERTKPVVNVGTIGYAKHGKTMITEAVKAVLASSIDDAGRQLAQGLIKERDDWRKWRQSSKFRGVRR